MSSWHRQRFRESRPKIQLSSQLTPKSPNQVAGRSEPSDSSRWQATSTTGDSSFSAQWTTCESVTSTAWIWIGRWVNFLFNLILHAFRFSKRSFKWNVLFNEPLFFAVSTRARGQEVLRRAAEGAERGIRGGSKREERETPASDSGRFGGRRDHSRRIRRASHWSVCDSFLILLSCRTGDCLTSFPSPRVQTRISNLISRSPAQAG